MELLIFLIGVVGISISGVMMPGPVTATAISMGSQNRYAGALISLGHSIVELPLMLLIVLGAAKILNSTPARILIGFIGGIFLLIMAVQMYKAINATVQQQIQATKGTPIKAGIILSAGNPYFLVWWATIGLGLATKAGSLGVWAFVLFALTHSLCDFSWLLALSWASYKGARLLRPSRQKIVLTICALVVLVFGFLFIAGACALTIGLLKGPGSQA